MTEKQLKENYPIFEYLIPNTILNTTNTYIDLGDNVSAFSFKKDRILVSSMLEDSAVRNTFPADLHFYWSSKEINEENKYYEIYAVKKKSNEPVLDNRYIKRSTVKDTRWNYYSPQMVFTKEGANLWGDLTGCNINNYIAICIDKEVYSCPTVKSKIVEGRAMLSSSLSKEHAFDVNAVISNPPLPVQLLILNTQVVDPEKNKG